jgi:hypothetical protein
MSDNFLVLIAESMKPEVKQHFLDTVVTKETDVLQQFSKMVQLISNDDPNVIAVLEDIIETAYISGVSAALAFSDKEKSPRTQKSEGNIWHPN